MNTSPHFSRFGTRLVSLAFSMIATAVISNAATVVWSGATDNDFQKPSNWTGGSFPNAGTDIFRFDSAGTQGNTTITNFSVTLTNTGTTAGSNSSQILINSTAPALTLTGGTLVLGTAASSTFNNAVTMSANANNQSVGSNVTIGDGGNYTASFVNAGNASSGVLRFSGNISGGTGGTSGTIALGFGNTSTHNGSYEVSGNITPGSTAAGINITKRGSGTLTLSGTNTLGNGTAAGLAQNEAGSTIRITNGTTTLNNGVAGNSWGGNNVAGVAPVVQISGGILSVQSARNLRNSLLIDGGTLNISNNRLSFDATNGNKVFTMTSGALNYNDTGASSSNFGVRFGGDNGASGTGGYGFTGLQSGGNFTVRGSGSQDGVFSLGSNTTSVAASYSLSGGTLNIVGNATATGFLTIGADIGGTGNTTFSLSGSGKLIVQSATTAGNGGSASVSGINGRNTGSAVQVLSLTGGTLVAGRIDATNLRASLGGLNGNVVNNGSFIAPGDEGKTGRTAIVGNLTLSAGSMLIDIAGTTRATTWQDTSPGLFDNVLVTGILTYGGDIKFSFGSYVPTIGSTYDIFDFASQSGTFSAITFDDPAINGSFDYATGVLTVTAVPEPSVVALLIAAGVGALARRRRRLG